MTTSIIKILSCSIYIAKQQNYKILEILLKDYVKNKYTKSQYLFIILLSACYKENNIFVNDSFYKILEKYIILFRNQLCRQLIFHDASLLIS
jgi:hypothetical protein